MKICYKKSSSTKTNKPPHSKYWLNNTDFYNVGMKQKKLNTLE